MTNQEFSNEFDVLLNSYSSKAQFGDESSVRDIELNEYEKSVFLTKAQEAIVISLYNGKNSNGDSFEKTEEIRRYLSNLVTSISLEPIENTSGTILGLNGKSKFFTLPDNLMVITYESVTLSSDDACMNGKELEVIPIAQDTYHKVKNNPFRGANKRRALRLDLSEGVVEIVSNYTVSNYFVRYLKKPTPIILSKMDIDNVSYAETPCELHESLHQRILEEAVRMALQSKAINIKNRE